MNHLRIIYMGTPEFAVEPLRAILEAGYDVLAVVTAPDKPSGRGQKLHHSAVKEFALKNNLPVFQPINLKNSDFISQVRSLNPNLQVVVAFRMLPEMVWQIPSLGTINLHASLLPQYRGAAPINHAIINGETETGLTTFVIEKEIDTGNILLTEKTSIEPSDDAGTLHDRMMYLGGKLLVKTLKMIETGTVENQKQASLINEHTILKSAPKIFRENCRINWQEDCKQIHNRIRGLSPFPGAFTSLVSEDGQARQMKIFKSSWDTSCGIEKAGTIKSDNKTYLSIFAGNGIIHIDEIQLEGKRRMKINEFLRGISLNDKYYCE